tara:strand:+ start:196 stop:300 length:105 start_codon:yes stop_codon:yes gene_type:complete
LVVEEVEGLVRPAVRLVALVEVVLGKVLGLLQVV